MNWGKKESEAMNIHLIWILQKLRGELDRLLKRKIEDPGFDVADEGKGVVAAVVELLHSQNVWYQ